MKINNVSGQNFKGLVQVTAPIKVAEKIATKINDNNDENLRKIICDGQKGDVVAFSHDENSPNSYIITGDDAKAVIKHFREMLQACESAGRYYGAGDLFNTALETLGERHAEFVKNVVSDAKLEKIVAAKIDENNEVKVAFEVKV